MELTTDSAMSDTGAVDQEDRQHMLGHYADEIIGRLTGRPHDSAPQLFQHATVGGPCLSQEDVLRLFGDGSYSFERVAA